MDSYTFNTPIGFLTIREEEQKLTNLFWQADSERVLKNERHSDFLYEVYIQVNEYFAGRRRQFDVPLKSEGTLFQQSVWRQLQKIPYGQTRSYQEIARDKGFSVEDMEAYYDEADFADYTHALSKARILKAQHPDYEISQMGIHAQRGVSCADCHMPYKSEGGMKFSDHHIQSPLAMIDRTCQVCHRESEETLRNNVYDRQRKANEIRGRLEQELAKAHIEAKFAWDKGATDVQMAEALKLIRQAQWRWDFGVASHGGAFHAPQEIQRILGHGLDKALQARLAISKVLAQHGYTADVPMPDISTKEKAQEYIGLDMEKERKAKDKFLKTIVPEWLEKARANGRLAKL